MPELLGPADVISGGGRRGEALPNRGLVLLGDGPWRGRVYWADEFAQMQAAASRYAVTHPAGELAGYVRTERTELIPHNAAHSAEVWVFRPASRTNGSAGAGPR